MQNNLQTRSMLIVWNWNTGTHRVPDDPGYDIWPAEGSNGQVIRADRANAPDTLEALCLWAAHFAAQGPLLLLLHDSSRTHGFNLDSCLSILKVLERHEHAKNIKIELFGGGNKPVYWNPKTKHRGYLGASGNFSVETQDPNTGEKKESNVVLSSDPKCLRPEPFEYIWAHYWVGTRQKLYHLAEGFKIMEANFERNDYKHFTQYFRQEQGLFWQQLVHFAERGIEINKMADTPLPTLADFSQCEQHLASAYGETLAQQYRNARELVKNLIFVKNHRSPEEADESIRLIVNALDALQDAIPEELTYDIPALLPR
jgi:hypothetical protein